MGEILYDLVIQPIWLLLEIVFKTAYSICGNPGISIIFVSLVVNILVLPLYLKSDELQSDERKKQKQMEGWIKHIRKCFSGDERFMILQEYYRQNDYRPWHVLKSSFSLMLQIPFFIAAYRFLSDLQLLHGVSFLFIRNLGVPDATYSIGSFSINILPLAMTIVNLLSSLIYTKGGPIREKIQTIGMAIVFLILLYNSPSGLVLYWTLNNLFSLGKNIIMTLTGRTTREKKDVASGKPLDPDVKIIWLLSCLFISIFVGMIVPMSVIMSSPLEFVKRGPYADPAAYSVTTTAVSAGFLLVWGGVVFYMGSWRLKKTLSMLCLVSSVVFFFDFMVFTQGFGLIWDNLIYSKDYRYSSYDIIINLTFIVSVTLVLVTVSEKHSRYVVLGLAILSTSTLIIGLFQTVSTSVDVRKSDKYKKCSYEVKEFSPILKLSRSGKNVVFLVLDKAQGSMVPYILNEKPDLLHEFSGFTYYPNTVSFSGCTISGAPAMYGGYEYTTWNINQRSDELLKDKINQSLKLMPTLFSREGYHSTLCDIPYGNYQKESDFSIFDDVGSCETHWLTTGEYSGLFTEDEEKAVDSQHLKRNFFYYSLCRVVPLVFQSGIYDEGKYHEIFTENVTDMFANNYLIMEHLPELTDVTDEETPQFVVMHNNCTHDGTILDPPDYVLKSTTEDHDPTGKSVTVDGRTMHIDTEYQLKQYDVNVCAWLLMGKWLRYLKENGVYDNTRIIIVADHGYPIGQFDDMVFINGLDLDVQGINPLLLFKDFDSQGNLLTDNTFMSNADAPILALKDIINNPVNPFTGVPVTDAEKKGGPLVVCDSQTWELESHDPNKYCLDGIWYTIHDNIFERDNWTRFDE